MMLQSLKRTKKERQLIILSVINWLLERLQILKGTLSMKQGRCLKSMGMLLKSLT